MHAAAKTRKTPAEELGMTQELGEAVAALAGEALAADRPGVARDLLEGLVVLNPAEPAGWALLSGLHRRLENAEAARTCAELAAHLAPADPWARLALAEALLSCDECRARGRLELLGLAGGEGPVGERARALIEALDAGSGPDG
jgi:predicted Zn-dependent protease